MSDIFDLFVQGQNRGGAQGGLGLGLVVVKQLTELHGGTVAVASGGDGRGTKFTIRLPRLSAGSVAPGPAVKVPLAPTTSARQRVLLVDDNEDSLDLLSTFLENAGHEVSIAHDGSEALTLLDRFHPSVAVLDITMPVMGGCELAERIRAHPDGQQPYLIALTGYGQASDRERTRAAGFNEHLVKPVDLADLLRVIDLSEARAGTLGGAGE
ncbi:MAG TPA: response regulator [Polyangiaceae bacterium]|nr:response regulator [Polyangiaceae bacterium]